MLKIFKSNAGNTDNSTKKTNSIEALINAKNATAGRNETRFQQSDDLLHEALILIEQFRKSPENSGLLLKASEKLEQSLKYNHNKAESYFWQAYILFNFAQIKGAIIYLKKAESLKPDYPQIQQLKSLISKN